MSTQTEQVKNDKKFAYQSSREQMDLVTVGHVDHGKSTVIGRLLADTGSLPEGKLEKIKAQCARNSRPFEYAFLLDALKNEQAQGITVDAARCFFNTEKRHYIINDAPGHIEFLKNMVTGAARAEAALLIIDAEEGIQENSKRHGYILSMLGIHQVSVIVNKMDLVDYSEEVFNNVRDEYLEFLSNLGVVPVSFIPVSGREGDNLTTLSENTPWYTGRTILEQVDAFESHKGDSDRLFRMPVQDVYKFTANGDDRRIVAGTVETGTVRPGDEVVFLPSGKSSTVKTVEVFNVDAPEVALAGEATGFTLNTQIYIKPGDIMCRKGEEPPRVATRFRANVFWMGHSPLIAGKQYKLKLGAARVPVELVKIINVLDASELSSIAGKQHVDRHDVAECVLETARPVAFDLAEEIEKTARFVLVDNYEIAGCGIILEEDDTKESLLAERVHQREMTWEKGYITPGERAARYRHPGKFILFAGESADVQELAKKLELKLFMDRFHTYYLSTGNVFDSLDQSDSAAILTREDQIHRLGELARLMTDAGLLFITTLKDAEDFDLEKLKLLNEPNEAFVISVGETNLDHFTPHLSLAANPNIREAIDQIILELNKKGYLPEYSI